LYASGETEKVAELASSRLKNYPTELIPRFILMVTGQNRDHHIGVIRDFVGEIDFTVLETSLVFSRIGLFDEAINILESICMDPVLPENRNHLIQYQLAYLNHLNNNNQKAGEYLRKAATNYQDFINASKPEMEATLKYALSVNPNDALAAYQLGNLYGNFGRLDEAEKYWKLATASNPSKSIPWRNLGLYYWVVKNDHDQSEACYRSAISARPLDQTLYRDLAKVLEDNDKRKEAITLLETMPFKGTQRSDLVIDLAQYYLDDGRYDDCINLLSNAPYFVNWEGSSITWNIFNNANVKKGIALYENGNYRAALRAFEKALTWPENLGVGRSKRTEEAMAWFWKGKTLLMMNRNKDAIEAWKAGANSHNGSERQNTYKKLCADLQR
jgi:tetratricopeptide (TPR) repeat protein